MNATIPKEYFQSPLRISDNAASDVAKKLREFESEIIGEASEVYSIGSHVERALFDLGEVYDSARNENEDCAAVPGVTYDEAQRFIKALPNRLPMPEFAPTPAGDLSMEWYADPNKNFTVILEGTNTLIYSSRFGKNDREYGRKAFNDVIPKSIIQLIKRVYR